MKLYSDFLKDEYNNEKEGFIKNLEEETETIDPQFCSDYNEVKSKLQNHKHQLESFLGEYQNLEKQELMKI